MIIFYYPYKQNGQKWGNYFEIGGNGEAHIS